MTSPALARAAATIVGGAVASIAIGLFVVSPVARADASATRAVQAVPCLPVSDGAAVAAAVTYTFDPITATGTVTLAGPAALCTPFIVRATSYAFTTSWGQWPQRLIGYQDVSVQAPGTYPFAAPARGCGQSDVYAAWSVADLAVPAVLTGSGQPFEPPFIWTVAGNDGVPWTLDGVPCVPPTTPPTTPPITSSSATTPPVTTSSSATTTPPVTTSSSATTTPPVTTTSGRTSTPPVTTTSVSTTTTTTSTTTTAPPVTTTTAPPVTTTSSPVPSVSGTTTTKATTTSAVATTTSPVPSISDTSVPKPPGPLPFTGGNEQSIVVYGLLGCLAGLVLLVVARVSGPSSRHTARHARRS